MPSGPPELHAKWKSDGNALDHLCASGFRMTKSYDFIHPNLSYRPTPNDLSALTYLQLEWDYGGMLPREQAMQVPESEIVPWSKARQETDPGDAPATWDGPSPATGRTPARDPAFSNAPKTGSPFDGPALHTKITVAELQELFGATMPIAAAVILQHAADPDEARLKLKELAAKQPDRRNDPVLFQLRMESLPGPGDVRFIEAETPDGISFELGQWEQDGRYHLIKVRISDLPVPASWKAVLTERARQVLTKGYIPEQDDGYVHNQLAYAAACYAVHGNAAPRPMHSLDEDDEGNPTPPEPPEGWPWEVQFWKPGSHRRNLEKAGALILAELERLDRREGIE